MVKYKYLRINFNYPKGRLISTTQKLMSELQITCNKCEVTFANSGSWLFVI